MLAHISSVLSAPSSQGANGNRREPMKEGIRGKVCTKHGDVVFASLFNSDRLEWECNYCTMFYDGSFFKRLKGKSDSIPLTEKEMVNFKFATAAAAKKDVRIHNFILNNPHPEFEEIGYPPNK